VARVDRTARGRRHAPTRMDSTAGHAHVPALG
jgi:hypothetical protein